MGERLGARDVGEEEAGDGEREGLELGVGRVDVVRGGEERLDLVKCEQHGPCRLRCQLVEQRLQDQRGRLVIDVLGCELSQGRARLNLAVTEGVSLGGLESLEGIGVGGGKLGEKGAGEDGLVEEGAVGVVDVRSGRVDKRGGCASKGLRVSRAGGVAGWGRGSAYWKGGRGRRSRSTEHNSASGAARLTCRCPPGRLQMERGKDTAVSEVASVRWRHSGVAW